MREEPLIDCEADVMMAITAMKQIHPKRENDTLELINSEIESIKYKIDNEMHVMWPFTFAGLGHRLINLIKDFNPHVLAKILVQKHEHYGPEALTRWGAIGVLIRIDSKLQRARHLKIMVTEDLIKGTEKIDDESFDDTMMDMVGYCILAYIMVNRKKV